MSSGLFAASTTDTSTGAVNSSHDSFTPLGGVVPLVNMMFGEVSPGGVGSGLYGMLIFALLAVFIAGLMVGRTPEYLGKKIQAAEMKLVVLYLLAVPLVILALRGGVGGDDNTHRRRCSTRGRTGSAEVTYAFTSAANNNGSAFAGLNGNTDWYNITLAICMLVGRFVLIVPVLAIAGSLARKQTVPESAGTFPTDTPAVRRTAGRRDRDRRRPHLLARLRARPHRRAPRALRRTMTSTLAGSAPTSARLRLFEPAIVKRALRRRLRKLDPRHMVRNPVMFVVEVGSVLTTIFFFQDLASTAATPTCSRGSSVCSALVHGRLRATSPRPSPRGAGKAQAETLRKTSARRRWRASACPTAPSRSVPATALRVGDECVVTAGEVIPGDGDVVEGIASVDESAITGESAPVIRESGGDRSAVTGGTRVLSDRDRGADHREAGRDLPRPDDRARRGRRPAEDAQRDRARHPARGPHDHLPARQS